MKNGSSGSGSGSSRHRVQSPSAGAAHISDSLPGIQPRHRVQSPSAGAAQPSTMPSTRATSTPSTGGTIMAFGRKSWDPLGRPGSQSPPTDASAWAPSPQEARETARAGG
eukprot:5209286-Pyramimonas_sp.AAC.1